MVLIDYEIHSNNMIQWVYESPMCSTVCEDSIGIKSGEKTNEGRWGIMNAGKAQ